MMDSRKTKKRFSGEGKDLNSALRDAIRKLSKVDAAPDDTIKWRLVEIKGEIGGFFPKSVIIVVIELSE